MSAAQEYRTICRAEEWQRGRFWRTECEEDALVLSPGSIWGAACLGPIDGTEKGFAWNRVKLAAQLPRDAGVRVYARASDDRNWSELDENWSEGTLGNPRAPLDTDGVPPLEALFGEAVAGTDVLLRVTGQYLWLAVELASGGETGPRIDAVSIRFSGDHLIDYLPSIYQEQDFTYRWLSIYNSLFQDLEQEIDSLPGRLDVDSADAELLSFLGRCVCLDEGMPQGLLREMIPHALEFYESMYTAEGIRRSAWLLSGQRPELIEYFDVDPNLPSCQNPALYRRLYGENPYRFFLLFPYDTFSSQRDMERFLSRMRDRIPAETDLELILLKPCVQLDWHTYLGLNSRIGSFVPAAIDETQTIHYDTTIGGTDHER
ncbi:MAG: hypothetical protein IJT94_14930 [Oscillibacter sp.]|nr:hypothetical protein [Oscillibacter sp.]